MIIMVLDVVMEDVKKSISLGTINSGKLMFTVTHFSVNGNLKVIC